MSFVSRTLKGVSEFWQGPRSKFLSGGAKDERMRQIGVGGGNA